MNELANCPICGKLFVKGVRTVCPDCFKEEEEAFEKVYSYIRQKENRMATIPEVSEATGVDEDLIIKFVKEKRIQTVNFPNLFYGCERCGKPIQEGKICSDCRVEIRKELLKAQEMEEFREKIEREKAKTYYSVDKKPHRKY
jgi:flagellar operon protein (TIGR03826 family)